MRSSKHAPNTQLCASAFLLAVCAASATTHAQPRIQIELQPALERVVEAAAPPPASSDDRLAELVADLGSPNFETRERAEATLRAEFFHTLQDLEQCLEEEQLTIEQRARLEQVAWQRFASTERAGLGVSFPTVGPSEAPGGGVIIESTVATPLRPFDAQTKLRAGDIIVAADETPTPTRISLQHAIISRDPGDIMRLSVQRDNETIDVDVRLGRFADLNAGAGIVPGDPVLLRGAWNARLQRVTGDDDTMNAAAALEPTEIFVAQQAEAFRVFQNNSADRDTAAKMTLVAGGSIRPWSADSAMQAGLTSSTRIDRLRRLGGMDAASRIQLEQEILALEARVRRGDRIAAERLAMLDEFVLQRTQIRIQQDLQPIIEPRIIIDVDPE
ncbi:MAG: PDZ domain-containing protein [Planctomycetota bacterium]